MRAFPDFSTVRQMPQVRKAGLALQGPWRSCRRMRQTNSKFAKRTWNVPWNQQFHFLASHFSIADREARPAGSARFAPKTLRLFEILDRPSNAASPKGRTCATYSHRTYARRD